MTPLFSGDRKVYIMMTLTALFWAGAFIGGKIGVQEIPPFSLTFFRFLFATAIVFPILIKAQPDNWRLRRDDWPVIISLGLTGMFGYHALFFYSLKYTTAINTSLISASSPVITTVFASLFVGEALGFKRTAAVLLAFVGVLLTLSNGNLYVFMNTSFNTGDILMITASLCKACYIVLSRKVSYRYSPLTLTSYSFLVCLVVSVPFMAWENPTSYLHSVSWKGWLSVIYMSVFASVLGYLIQQISIKSIGVSKTTAFENLVPIFTIILSVLILQESVSFIKIISAAIIIIGVYLNSILKLTDTTSTKKAPS